MVRRRLSTDYATSGERTNPFWTAVGSIYDSCVSSRALARAEDESGLDLLLRNYVRERRGDDSRSLPEMASRLPEPYGEYSPGFADMYVLDFVLHRKENRVLHLCGPQGCGKTTLVHFVEAIARRVEGDAAPIFLILNGLATSSMAPNRAEVEDLIGREIQQAIERAPDSTKPPLRAAARVLRDESLESALRTLVRELPDRDTRRVILVFDNLDQLASAGIVEALHVAVSIYEATGIGAIVNTRPPTMRHIAGTGTAHSYFAFRFDLHAPQVAAWLRNVRDRIVRAAPSAEVPRVQDRPLSPEHLRVAFNRFVDLLESPGSAEHTGAKILEGMAGEDMRILEKLVPRCLRHRSLPYDDLLRSTRRRTDYYVFPGVAEDHSPLYRRNTDVPNLLAMEDEEEGPGYILAPRVLSLVAGSRVVLTARLTDQLFALGYGERVIRKCLKILGDASLITGLSEEKWEMERPPARIAITLAGVYYLRFLLRDPDYLSAVVADVPLEHERFSQAIRGATPLWVDDFANRLDSLSEYAAEAHAREESEIAQVMSLGNTRRRALLAEALLTAGLVCESLSQALRTVAARARHSINPIVQQRGPDVLRQADRLREWTRTTKSTLREMRSALVEQESELAEIAFEGPGINGVIRPAADPDAPARVRASCHGDVDAITLQLFDRPSGTAISQGVMLRPNIGVLPGSNEFHGDIDMPRQHRSQHRPLFAQATPITGLSKPQTGKQTAILLATSVGSSFSLNISIATGQEWEWCGQQTEMPIEEARRRSADAQRSVAAALIGGEPLETAIRTAGTALTHAFLSPGIHDRLRFAYSTLADTMIGPGLDWFPAEWMCPLPGAGRQYQPLGEQTSVVRVPATPYQTGGFRLSFSTQDRPPLPLALVGLSTGNEPSNLDELIDVFGDNETVHLVGHAEEDGIRLSDRFVLKPQDAMAHILPAAHVVISACRFVESGTGETTNPSVAVAGNLAVTSGCHVWASLVNLRDTDALSFHHRLVAHLDSTSPAASLARSMAALPDARLYSHYYGAVQGDAT